MEVKKASPSAPAIKWALIGVVTSIILTYAFDLSNIDPNSKLRWISYIPFIAFLCLSQKEYRNQLGGYLTYGEGFQAGLLYSVFMGILAAIFTYLYFAVLSPEMLEKILASSEAQLQAKNMSQDQIDTAMSMTRKFMKPGIMAVFGLIGTIIMGVIIALITAAIFKKERPPFLNAGYDEPQPLDSTV
jgi:hypothetical protein